MTITVDIKPEVHAELARQAAAHGSLIDAYVASLLEEAVHLPSGSDKDRAKAGAADATGQQSAVAREATGRDRLNGRAATGMYPMVSRTKLAQETGKDITTISQIMRGRIKPGFEVAIVISKLVGVGIEDFERDWKKQRKKFTRDRKKK